MAAMSKFCKGPSLTSHANPSPSPPPLLLQYSSTLRRSHIAKADIDPPSFCSSLEPPSLVEVVRLCLCGC